MSKSSLDEFIDETIRRSLQYGYTPTIFMDMRRLYGTKQAISRLVTSGTIQSGFSRLVNLGLKEYTIEQAVVMYPEEFSAEVLKSAKWRLGQAAEEKPKT